MIYTTWKGALLMKPLRSRTFILTGLALIIIYVVQRGIPLLVTGIALMLIGIAIQARK